MTKKLKTVFTPWIKGANELGIRVEAPYRLEDKQGHSFEFIAYLPDSGGDKGAIFIGATPPGMQYDHEATTCAEQHGFHISTNSISMRSLAE